MTLKEMKKKVLSMIEELNPEASELTDDVDIAEKLHSVINQIMFEMCRFKKIPKDVELTVAAGQRVAFEDIEEAGGYAVYQLDCIRGDYELRAGGSVIKCLSDSVLEIDYFAYPERITEKTKDNYEFELSDDVLEVMPYGIAADLLKSDVSSNYGRVYSDRYEALKQSLDPRLSMGSFSVEGGIDV